MRIGIAIPYYGDFGYLKQTVQSVINQEAVDWELLVVDDCYPDPAVRIWFESIDDARVRYERNETNLGANLNFAKCLQLIRSDYICILGADDVLLQNYVGAMQDLILTFPDADFFQPTVEIIDGNGHLIRTLADSAKKRIRSRTVSRSTETLRGEEATRSLMFGNWLYFPSIVWKVSTIRNIGWRDSYNVVQDLALAADVLMQDGTLVVANEKMFQYRRHEGADSRIRALNGDRFEEEHRYFESIAKDLDKLGWKKAAFSARWHLTSRLNAVSLAARAIQLRIDPRPLLRAAVHRTG